MSYSKLFDCKSTFKPASMTPDANGDYLLSHKTGAVPVEFSVWVPPGAFKININFYAAIEACVGFAARVGQPPTADYSTVTYPYWYCFSWDRDGGKVSSIRSIDCRFRNRSGHGFIVNDYFTIPEQYGFWLYLKKLDNDLVYNMHLFEYAVIVKGQDYRDWWDEGGRTSQFYINPLSTTDQWLPNDGCQPQTEQQQPDPGTPGNPQPPVIWPFPKPPAAQTYVAEKGDIIFHMTERVDPGEPGALQQYYKAYFQETGWDAGTYGIFFNQRTYDDTDRPFGDGKRRYWFHCELATQNMLSLPAKAGVQYAVVRMSDAVLDVIDMKAAADKYLAVSSSPNFRYGQPFVAMFLNWMKSLPVDLWAGSPPLRDRVKEMFGIDLDAINIRRWQYSKASNELNYTDIHHPEFWTRDLDCSSLVMFCILHGWDIMTSGQIREAFLGQWRQIGAIDCASPGIVAAYLVENEAAYIL